MKWSQLPLLNCSQNENKPWPKAQEMTEKTLFHPQEIRRLLQVFWVLQTYLVSLHKFQGSGLSSA